MKECDWIRRFEKILESFEIPKTTVEFSPDTRDETEEEREWGSVGAKNVEVEHEIKLNKILFSDGTALKVCRYELVEGHPEAEFLSEEDVPLFVFFHEVAHILYGHPLSQYALKRGISKEDDEAQDADADFMALQLCRAYRARSDVAQKCKERERGAD